MIVVSGKGGHGVRYEEKRGEEKETQDYTTHTLVM
jgi:hypothetical protein